MLSRQKKVRKDEDQKQSETPTWVDILYENIWKFLCRGREDVAQRFLVTDRLTEGLAGPEEMESDLKRYTDIGMGLNLVVYLGMIGDKGDKGGEERKP